MSRNSLYYLIFLSILGCKSTSTGKEMISASAVIKLTSDYLKNKPGLTPKTSNEKILVFTGSDNSVYSFNKESVFLGDLNNDQLIDAIASYQKVDSRNFLINLHIVFLNRSGQLVPVKEHDINMEIKKIEKGVVISEKSILTTDAPNYGCNACKETIRFKLAGDSLQQVL